MKLGFALFLLIYCHNGYGQGGLSIQSSVRYGEILGESASSKRTLYGFAIDINKETDGTKFWQAIHKYPQIGLQFSAYSSSNRSLGNILSVIPYMEFNIWKSDFGKLQIKHGTGLACATKHYHVLSNPENTLLGSRINAASFIDLGYEISLNSYWSIKAGASLGHISNGNLVQPNGGLNSLTGYGTLSYFPAGRSTHFAPAETFIRFRRWRYRISAMAGLYDFNKEAHNIQVNNQIGLLALYQHGFRFRSGMGLEISQLGSKSRQSVYTEEEVLIGHLATRYGLGIYLTNPGKTDLLYEKVGIAWYPCSLKNSVAGQFSVGAAIKAHAFRAAHVEISAGYTF